MKLFISESLMENPVDIVIKQINKLSAVDGKTMTEKEREAQTSIF